MSVAMNSNECGKALIIVICSFETFYYKYTPKRYTLAVSRKKGKQITFSECICILVKSSNELN
jgi:hypothetical protein